MGRARDWFDGKQREENRRLIEGYILKNTKKDSLPKTEYRANTEQINTAPTSYSPVKVEMDPVPSNDVSLAKKYSAGQTLTSEAMNNLKKYQSENATSNATFKAGVPEDMTVFKNQSNAKFTREELLDYLKPHKVEFGKEREAVGQDAFENRKEYQFYNNLSRVPIVGNYAPMLAGGEYVLSVPLSAAEGAVNLGKQAFSKEKLGPENFEFAKKSAALREGALRALRNNLGMQYDDVVDSREKTANFIGGVVADAASSSANNIALGRGSLAVAGLNAANQDMLESSQNERLTRNQLLASGIAHGATEAAWEFLPTMRFLELSKYGLGTSTKEITKNVLKQMGQEGIEEFGTDITNDITDTLIKGKESEVVKEYLARKENGENNTSAVLNTGASRLGSAGMSFLAGALSGGMSAGIAGATHTFSQGMQYNDVNNFKEIAESADTTTEEGKAIHEVANRLAEKEAKGQRITEFDRGYLSNAVENAAIEDYNRRKEELKSKDNLQESKDNHQKEAEAEKSGSVPYALFSNTEAGQQAKLESAINENLSKANRESIDYKNPLQEFSKNYDTEGRKAFVENYDGSVPLTEYIKASTHAYNLGRYNYNLDGEDSLEKTASMALLSKEQRESLFKAGVKDYENAISKWNIKYKERIEKRTGGLMDSVPHAPENLKNVLGALGKKTGILFRIVDSKYQDGNTSNGSYEMGKGIITIDLQSDNILGTVSHEMTHWIKEYAGDGADQGYYGWFKGLALNSILKSKNTDLDSLIETYKQSYGNLSNEEITDEIVADSTMHFLNDEEFINKLVNGTEEQKSIGMKVVQWLNDIIESFKDLISHNGERLASRALREDLARYEETRDAWLVAMSMAKENMAKYEAVTENSDSEELSQVQLQKVIEDQADKPIEDRVEDVLTNKNFTDSHVYLNDTPQVLQDLGLRNLPMLMTSMHVYKAIKTEQEAINEGRFLQRDKDHYHELGKQKFIDVVNALESPEIVYKDNSDPNDLQIIAVVGLKNNDNYQIMVAIKPEGKGNYNKISVDSNVMLSMYGRKNLQNKISDAQKDGRILYVKNLNNNSGILQTPVSQLHNNPSNTAVANSLNQYKQAVNQFLKKNGKLQELHQLDISEDYYNSLVEENENLKEENSYLSDVLNAETRFEPSRSDVNRIASDLLSQYNSQFSKAKLADQLSGFYKYLSEARDIEGGEVRNVSRAIAREVIENATYKEDSEVQDYNKVKEFFSGRPIYITEGELHDLGYEKFGDLRKQYFGKIDFRKATVENRGNADDVYKSFAEAFPHLVTGDKSYTDELNNLIEAYEMATPKVYEAFPGEEHDHAVDRLSDEIYDAFLSVGDERLYQKYKDGYKKIKEKARAEVQAEYQKKYTKALDKIKQLRKDYENSIISHEEFIDAESRLLSRGGAEYQARLEMHRAYRQKQEEQRHRQLYKKEIVRDSKALMKMAVNPTDNLHVPKVLLKDLVPVLSAVDFSSYDAFYEKKPKIEMTANEFKGALATLTSRIQEAENNGDVFTEENGKGVYFPIDPSLKEGLEEIKNSVSKIGGNMNRLNTEELQTLRDSLRGFKHIVESQNKYISMKNGERVSDVAQEVIQEFKGQDARKELWGIAGNAKDFLSYGMMDAYTFFHEMGDGGHKVYKVLRNARDKKTQALSHIEDSFKEAMKESNIKAKNLKKLSTDTVKFSALATNKMQTAEVEMTKAQLMSLYLHNLREQSRMHLYGLMKNDATGEMYEGNERLGGFKVRERRGRGLKKLTVIKDVNTYKMTEAELNTIVKENLSENEIKFAQRIGQILSNEVAKYGNEASNAVYGYDKFTEKNYFPIKVDSDSLTMKNTDLEKMMSTLKNKGMTKALQKEAYNPIMIDDIFEVAMSHIDEMTSYASYFPAIIDMQKFYNFADENGDSVHRELSRVMGKGGTEYYMNLLRDLNGSRGGSNFIDKLAQGFSGPYKGSMVLANARVAIQQPTAYLRALNVIEHKYLAQGLTLPKSEANTEWENAKKYAPIAQWKAMSGSYDINVGKSLRRQFTGETTLKNAITDITAIPLEAADEFAWKRLWYASEKKVEDTTSLKKGTEEYYKAAAEIFNEIIDATQVVDSVLNRTDAMKSTSGLVKLSTSFMSEPSKTYNMVYRTYSDFKKGKATKKQMVSVLAVATLGAAVTSGVASLISAMRNRDKDKKFGERWLDAFIRDFTDNLKPWTYVPILKDFIEALDTKQYGSNNFATKPITEAVRAIKALSEFRNEDSKLGWLGNIYQASNALNILGIPMHNALRDIGAFYDTAIYDSPLANVGLQYERDKMIFNMEGKNSKGNYVNVNRFLSSALKAYTLGDQKTGDKIVSELKARLGDDLITEKLQEALSKDDMIIEIAEKNLAGEDTTTEREALLHSGYSEAMIDKALGNAYKKLKPIEGDDLAEKLFEQSEDYKDSLDAYVEYQRAIGADEKKIRSSIKSAVTSKYKKLYQDAIGNPAVSDEILKKILRITYDGKQLYTEKDLKQWAKE